MSKGMRISVSAAAVWIALVVAGSYWQRHAKVRASTKGRQGNSALMRPFAKAFAFKSVRLKREL